MTKDKDKKIEKLNNEVSRGLSVLGLDKWEGEMSTPFSKEFFGLCSTCRCLKAAKTRYGRIKAKCYEFEVELHGIDPVVECTAFSRRGEMDLSNMKEIALLIDITKKSIGFKSEKENSHG